MDLELIMKLMLAMEERDMTKMTLKEKNGVEIHLERMSQALPETPQSFSHRHIKKEEAFLSSREQSVKTHEPSHSGSDEDQKPDDVPEGGFITSPMVGTYYAAVSPEDEPYVKEGDVVEEDSVVCIIEAMKVMNEVKAGQKGVIKKILIENGQPVEYGSKLFQIVPSS